MPSVSSEKINHLKLQIAEIRRGGSLEDPKPHKLILLLAVLELANSGHLTQNRIPFDDQLLNVYAQLHEKWARSEDWSQPSLPYFHLKTSAFWFHKPIEGREREYAELTKPGGGSKRILENIEFAYLSDEAFEVISDHVAREQIRQQIQNLIRKPKTDMLGTSFHETFPLILESVRQVMIAISAADPALDLSRLDVRETLLRESTHLGTRYVKAMPRYAQGMGLLNDEFRMTEFGDYAYRYDPGFELLDTKWLLHYFLSAPQGPGPQYWHDLVKANYRSENDLSRDQIVEQIIASYSRSEGSPPSERTWKGATSAFVGTYTKQEGLAQLGLLKEVAPGRYVVGEPEAPSAWAFGYALFSFWFKSFGANRLTVNLSAITGEEGISQLFLMGAGKTGLLLETLMGAGFVDLYQSAPPFQVVLKRPDTEELLQRIYAQYQDS